MRQLLKAIEESGDYNTIIIDMDGIFGEKRAGNIVLCRPNCLCCR